MKERKYLNDLKNLQPKPLDLISRSEVRGQKSEKLQLPCPTKKTCRRETSDFRLPTSAEHNSKIINSHNNNSEISMERLNTSKTMWGFGIAVFIYIMQSLLVAFNITSADNLILKTFIEVVIAISGFFGVYGVRDALRKMAM